MIFYSKNTLKNKIADSKVGPMKEKIKGNH